MSDGLIPKTRGHDISRLVERQMRNWELARAQRLQPKRVRPIVEDFVTVSRQVGAGGSAMAQRLAHRLDWPLFDREILHKMAGDDAIREQIYSNMDERDLSWIEEACRALMQAEFIRNDYYHQLCRTVLALARQGHAVFLGRAADLILPQDRGLRIRIVAPRITRIQSFAQSHGLALEKAEAETDRIERQRSEFIQHHFNTDFDDQTRHDLIINLKRLSVDQAVELAMMALVMRGISVPLEVRSGS